MNPVDLIRRLHEHRIWSNHQLLRIAETLTDAQLHQAHTIGQGSIWRSLLHLYAGEFVWLEALRGQVDVTLPGDVPGDLPGSQRSADAIASRSELTGKWRELDARWTLYLSDLRPEMLVETIYKVSTSSGYGQKLAVYRSDVLLHVATHAQYTTAQVVNMLRRIGVRDLPDVMLISLARQQHPANRGPSV